MSWLLVALIPGLLMLATFGLERLESGLDRDTMTATDVDEFLQQAASAHVDTPAREGISHPLNGLSRRLPDEDSAPSLPTRLCVHHGSDSQFQPTRHANPV